ncbi:helix-turn-helix transcriptional regulator [Nocardioides sp. 1609]|uniref:helix-turn-helix transcriptional regulator n=1 Tax=Nocardioides sp. 1609 TaxID=2508327 RepID=UPI00106F3772|nr:helix-turn-helix transcriptional regulator [Nocardioides sp. 1609]
MQRNVALREFLRARRAAIQPSQVGLDQQGIRRVSGLRREEVAMLAGVSVDYYARLEQGRDIQPSRSVLESIARALRLTDAQRSQLYALINRDLRVAPSPPCEITRTEAGLLGALNIPALVVGRGTAIVASNQLHRALTTNFEDKPPEQRYYIHWLFNTPAAQLILVDWARSARETVGVLRAAITQFPDDSGLQDLANDLLSSSAQFKELWDEHDVEAPSSGPKGYRHPELGVLSLQHQVARLSEEHWLHLYWAEPGSSTERVLEHLQSET